MHKTPTWALLVIIGWEVRRGWTPMYHVLTKASELVPCSLLPHWNSMRFFATGSLYDSGSKIRPCTGEVQTRHEYCNLYVTMLWLRHVRAGTVKFPESWLWTLLLRQKIHHFFFSQTRATRFKYLPEVCPCMLKYSALQVMQWFSHILDVFTPKIRRKFFYFNIFMNQNKGPLLTCSDR